jgi:hypothetical protein
VYYEKRLLAQNPSATGYIEAGNETSAFPGDIFDIKKRNAEFSDGVCAVEEMSDTCWCLDRIWLPRVLIHA